VVSQKFRNMSRVLALAFVVLLPSSLVAQVAASQGRGNPNAPAPKWDIFVGYSILDPRGTFYPIQPDGSVLPVSFKLEKTGMLESATYYFSRHVGLQVETGEHDLFTNTGFVSTGSSNSGIFSLDSGLLYRWPGLHFTPFVHGFGGAADIDGPDHEPYTWGPIVGGGGGLDWYFGCHFGVRLFEADYEYLHANSGLSHGSLATDNFVWGDNEDINALRLAAGVVFRGSSVWGPAVGCGPLPPPVAACVATPGVVFPGEPVTVTVTPSGLNPKKTVTYTWSGAGATSIGDVATIETASLTAGNYTVQSTVQESGKNGASADCAASFTVKPWEPPTLSCDAGPLTIHPDETSTVTLNGRSPQNRPLTYKCTSSNGKIDVTGNTAIFTPDGSPEGPVTINCTVNDDKGQTADCNASVSIAPRLPPPVTQLVPLCSIDFSNDKQRPTRVDNEAKACLDQVALSLQQHPDDTLLVVGEAADTGVGAQRAVNTKNYLTTEKGIDASRITVVTGNEGTQGVEEYLVPTGASYSSTLPNTHPVDEGAVKPQERQPLPTRTHPHRPAAAQAAANPPAKKPAHVKKKADPANKPAAKPSPAQGSTGP
jgi:hypothetical protein